MKKLAVDECIPLSFDTVFTGIFNDEANIEILESLVETFLEDEYGPVKGNLHIKKRELDSRARTEKKGQVDVILSMHGVKINLEMNRHPSKRTLKRNAIYASGIYGRGMKVGDSSYEDLPKVVQIDFNLGYQNQKHFIKNYYLMSPEEGDVLTKDFRIIYVDLEKYLENRYNKDEKKARWAGLLCTTSKKTFRLLLGDDLMSKEAKERFLKKMDEYSEDEEIFTLYSDYTKEELNFNSRLAEAKEEAIQEGIKEGLEEGFKEGKEETLAKIVKKLLKEKVDISFVEKITGLSKEEIEALK